MNHFQTRNLFLLVTSPLIVAILFLAAISNQSFVNDLHGDSLFGFEVIHNLLNNGTIRGQDFPIAPYFFPDLMVLFLLKGLKDNIALWHYAYSLIFLATYNIVVFYLINSIISNRIISIVSTFFAMIMYFFILPEVFFLQDWPLSHQSVALFTIFFIAFYTRHSDSSPRPLAFLLLLTTTFLILVSDRLLLIQLIIPLLPIVLLDFYFKKNNATFNWYILGLITLGFVSILLSNKIYFLLEEWFGIHFSMHPAIYSHPSLLRTIKNFPETWKFYWKFIRPDWYFYVILLAYNTMSLILACILAVKLKKPTLLRKLLRILLFFYLAPMCSIIISILAGKIHPRYFDIFYIFPSITFALMMAICLKEKFFRVSIIVFMSIAALTCILTCVYRNFDLIKQFHLNPPYSPIVACIDNLKTEYPIQNGLAEFWQVRPTRMLSKEKIHITQIGRHLEFFNQTDNDAQFFKNSREITPFAYQFIIVNNLPKETILKEIGHPDTIKFCQQQEIWLYLKDPTKLTSYFANHIHHIRHTYTYK